MLRISKNTLKKTSLLPQISNHFLSYKEKSAQKSLRPYTFSEFHQLSGGSIYFCYKFQIQGVEH